MAALKCIVSTCSYNQDKCCCKGDIMVGGKHAHDEEETSCDSFRAKSAESFVSSMQHPYQTISIDCEAVKCVYNTNYKCYAQKVDISGSNADSCSKTACATFKEK